MLALEPDRIVEIEAALSAAGRGLPNLLVVEGPPGSGKSSLLRAAVEQAGDRFGSVVIESAEGDRGPYSTLSRFGITATPQSSPLVVGQAVRERLDAIAASRPALLAVDDVQWADPETITCLVRLIERSDQDALVIALATHPLPFGVHDELQEYLGRGTARHLRIDGVSLASATAMARIEHPFIDEITVERVWRLTHGNPLYMSSILREYSPEELARMAFLPAPEVFSRSVARRLDRLGPDAVALMRASAVLGVEWQPVPVVAAVAGVRSPSSSVASLVSAGLLAHQPSFEFGGSVRPVHELVQAAVFQRIDLDQRRDLHLAAAQVVTDVHKALAHRVAAADAFDAELADELEVAARHNHRASAFRRAADQLGWSSRLTPNPGLRRDRYLDSLFERLFANDLAGLEQLVEGSGDDDRVALIRGGLTVVDNRWREAITALAPILEQPMDATDPLLRYRAEVLAAYAGMGSGKPTEWIRGCLARAAESGAHDPGLRGFETLTAARMEARMSGTTGFRSSWDRLPQNAAEVPVDATYRLMLRGIGRVGDGAPEEAIVDLEEVERRFHRGVVDVADGITHSTAGLAYWLMGDWQRAEVKFRMARAMQRRIPNPLTSAITTIGSTGRGDLAATDHLLSEVRSRLLDQPWVEGILWYVTARAVRLHAEGDAAAQARELDDLEHDFGAAAIQRRPGFPLWLIHRIPLSIWAGRLDEARSLTDALHEVPGHLPWVTGAEHWFRGLIAERLEQPARARRYFDDALNADIGRIPILEAHVIADRARVDGDSATLEKAVAAYRALGQVPYVERLVLDGHERVEPRPVVLEQLSDRERDVVALVTSGLSYEQISKDLFISKSTVAFHLSNIYAKTGTKSRHDLTALVRG